MDMQSILKSIGFDEKLSGVYLAALASGEVSITELARNAGLKRPTAYLVVEELQMLGMLSVTLQGKRKAYSAVHPHRLLELTRFRARRVEEVLPELVALHNAPKSKPKIQVFEGAEGVRALYRELYQSLNNKEEALWFARIGALREYLPESLSEYKKLLRQLHHPKIRELNFGDEDGKRWLGEMKRLRGKHHHIRLLPTDFEFGYTDNLIFGNKLVIFSLRRNAFVVIIESADVAATYRALFEWAWTQGKEC